MNRVEFRLIVAGTMLIGTTYGLARFAYGLFLSSMRDDVGLGPALAGIIGSSAYVGYCLAIVLSALLAPFCSWGRWHRLPWRKQCPGQSPSFGKGRPTPS